MQSHVFGKLKLGPQHLVPLGPFRSPPSVVHVLMSPAATDVTGGGLKMTLVSLGAGISAGVKRTETETFICSSKGSSQTRSCSEATLQGDFMNFLLLSSEWHVQLTSDLVPTYTIVQTPLHSLRGLGIFCRDENTEISSSESKSARRVNAETVCLF